MPFIDDSPAMASSSPSDDFRPSPPSRTSTGSSRSSRASLRLDLSNLPPPPQPTPPSNTLLFTGLHNLDVFRPDNLQTIRDLVARTAPIHAWAPLRSFRRIIVSFYSDDDAVAVRAVWDGEAVLGERCAVYFGRPTPLDAPADVHLALPDAGKLFFISPPPSPPHDWEARLEGAPNKQVHAADLADALARLHKSHGPAAASPAASPVSPAVDDPNAPPGPGHMRKTRSRSSTLIYQPSDHGSSPGLPAIAVEDTTEDDDDEEPEAEGRPLMAHTARPPVELMEVDG